MKSMYIVEIVTKAHQNFEKKKFDYGLFRFS